jgi:hypothetical protein
MYTFAGHFTSAKLPPLISSAAMHGIRVAVLVGAIATASLFTAATAQAYEETPPPPSGTDTSSYGSFGDSNLGGSIGPNGWSASLARTTVVSEGWPVTHTSISGPWGSWESTADYSGAGIEYWSKGSSGAFSFTNHADAYYNGNYRFSSTDRLGSSVTAYTVTCRSCSCSITR